MQEASNVYSTPTYKQVALPCSTNLHFNKLDYDEHNSIFGFNFVSDNDNSFYTMFLNEGMDKLNSNWVVNQDRQFHIFSTSPNVLIAGSMNSEK